MFEGRFFEIYHFRVCHFKFTWLVRGFELRDVIKNTENRINIKDQTETKSSIQEIV